MRCDQSLEDEYNFFDILNEGMIVHSDIRVFTHDQVQNMDCYNGLVIYINCR